MSLLSRYTLFQHAYVVTDLDAACQQWSELFGAGPFGVRHHHRADWFRYRGLELEADVSYAFGFLGDQQIQFVQQHDDTPSIYRDMYAADEGGFHHVGLFVHDYAAERRRFVDLGYEVVCELRHGDVEAGYIDTRAATGGFVELHTDPPGTLLSFAKQRRAHELRMPDDPAVLA